jgi:asparagine synthase (glutamine-hydrolysing)
VCGIAGLIDRRAGNGDLRAALDRMYPGIASRGPDGRGQLFGDGVALLNARLSIIDLVTGDQPVWNEDGTVGCVYNGEIYNYRELQQSLIRRGHRLATSGDTEVLVHLYEEHGARLVDHLHGMFAFAIYDRPNGRVVIARDRLGIKPLYVAHLGSRVAFGSSLSSLLALGASSDPDPASLLQYLRFYKVPEPRTAFRAVSALLPGHVMTIDVATGSVGLERFYELPPVTVDQGPRDITTAVAEARSAFEQAVNSHLVADVEVGAFLSGGIDSSLVVAQAQLASSKPIRTFSVAFTGGRDYDESPFAEAVARALGTKHETIEVRPVPAELLRAAITATGQPFAVASFLPLLALSRVASQAVKVVLTGDGGDEVAFGYPWHRWMRRPIPVRLLPRRHRIASDLLLLERGASKHPWLRPVRRAARLARGAVLGGAAASDAWRYDLTSSEALSLLHPDLRVEATRAGDFSPTAAAWLGEGPEALRRADLQVLLRDEMLPKLDRAGMAHGLEGRVPLLDDEFVSAMLAVPADAHLRHRHGKAVLRAWASELLPAVDLDRPKHGFDVPMAKWLRTGLRTDMERLLFHPSRPGLVDPDGARGVYRRMESGVPGAAHTMFALLLAELWAEGVSFGALGSASS